MLIIVVVFDPYLYKYKSNVRLSYINCETTQNFQISAIKVLRSSRVGNDGRTLIQIKHLIYFGLKM